MAARLLLLLLLVVLSSSLCSAAVVSLTDATFESTTQATTGSSSGDWFVEFYAPWCSHCQHLEPTSATSWEAVGSELSGEINVAKVDATAESGTATRFGISAFPTLLYLSRGSMVEYKGSRDKADLISWARQQAAREDGADGVAVGAPIPPPPSAWALLTASLGVWLHDLSHVLTAKTHIAVVLVLLGVLLGVLLTVAFLALTLGDGVASRSPAQPEQPPQHKVAKHE